eukprot:CCRYP_011140-RA/>CCRYP_011140-RA protein AED:0.49 eAED:0.49 QI:0/-1/0/1/-1/0/1/0/14
MPQNRNSALLQQNI